MKRQKDSSIGAFTRHSFWARPAWFTRQNMFESFQCWWFLERHPWNKNGTLKFVSPCTYMTAVHMWFQARFRQVRRAFAGCSKKEQNIADSRVQKQLYGSLLWKNENVCHNCGTKQGHPLHAPLCTCIRAATIRPAASYSGLYNTRRSQSNIRWSIGFDWIR